MKKFFFILSLFFVLSQKNYSENIRLEAQPNFLGELELKWGRDIIASNPGRSDMNKKSKDDISFPIISNVNIEIKSYFLSFDFIF